MRILFKVYIYIFDKRMDKKTIDRIFLLHGLGKVESVSEIEIGFTNKVYSINDKFILKVCEDVENESRFEKEVFFYRFFADKIPVPKIRVFDNSKKIYNKHFIIYPRIVGDNVYSKWHLLSNIQRKEVMRQFCEIFKTITSSQYKKFLKRFKLSATFSWHDKVVQRIKHSLEAIERKQLFSSDFLDTIKRFLEANHHVLNEQKICLVYWDAHFDNILIRNNQIVGILDFERTELASIDFTLDIIKRMVDYPKKYMSEKTEKYAKNEDYSKLLEWFQEFYPDPFAFKDIYKRLDLYALAHDLDDVLLWPNSEEIKQMIAKTVRGSGASF